MRNAFGLMLASLVGAVVIAGVWFWKFAPRADASSPQTMAARPADARSPATRFAPDDDVKVPASISDRLAALPTSAPQKPACANVDALGVARVVEIDTTGGPGFGFEHFKQLDFLEPKEVVLTFDDGPWPTNTLAVLKALDDECTKAVFFPIG